MLPKISITLTQGQLGGSNQTKDGIAGLLMEGITVAGAISVNTPHVVYSLADAEAKGIQSGGANDYAWTQIKAFYDEAGSGAELFIMLTDQTLENGLDLTNDYAKKLVQYAKGSMRLLGAGLKAKTTPAPEIEDGLLKDCHLAVGKAQALAEYFTNRYRPLRVVIGGNNYTGTAADLKDYKTDHKNRTALFIGAEDNTKTASIGRILGRLASKPVQRKLSRVLDGPIDEVSEAYLTDGKSIEEAENTWDTIHDKGYIFYRNHVGRAGYYFTSDPTLTSGADDYKTIADGRVIDKAFLISYDRLLSHLSDEVEINADGTISPALIKAWEGEVKSDLSRQMKQSNEISNVDVFIDHKQNVKSTNRLEVIIKIQKVGYADFIDVSLGYALTINA